ncbi:MAG: DUF3662 and FHA domain-containing protein [Micrococcaceae bacterium]
MGLMDKFENAIEKGIRTTFNRGGNELSPVDIANRLRREMDARAMGVSEGRTLAPNLFEIDLSTEDFSRAQNWGAALADELCEVGLEHAKNQSYHLSGPLSVTFGEDEELEQGVFNIESYIVKDGENEPTNPAGSYENEADHAAYSSPVANETNQTTVMPDSQAATVAVPESSKQQAVIDLDGQRYTLNASAIIIGRSTTSDIMLDDPGVSRRHLEVQVKGNKAYAIDLGSTNGTFVNGRKLQGSTELKDGSTLAIGHAKAVFRWLDS